LGRVVLGTSLDAPRHRPLLVERGEYEDRHDQVEQHEFEPVRGEEGEPHGALVGDPEQETGGVGDAPEVRPLPRRE
jgi:hypothetical protein